MSKLDMMTAPQLKCRIKHLEELLKEQVGRRGESNDVRTARWEARIAEAKRLGRLIPALPPGTYTDPVWLETGEIL